jgi:hypothetical protein
MRLYILGILGASMFALGFFLVYGTVDWVSAQDPNIMVRDVLISPGFALMGAGLYIIIRFIIFRKY